MSSSGGGSDGGGASKLPAAGAPAPAAACARSCAAIAAEELHRLRDDLGGPLLLALAVFPLARLETSLDVDRAALREVLRAELGGAAPRDDAMPLRLLFPAATVLLVPRLGGGEREVRDRLAALRVAKLRVAAEIPDQDGLVDACHWGALRRLRGEAEHRSRPASRQERHATLAARLGPWSTCFASP